MGEIVEQARQAAREKNGDTIALRALGKVQEAARRRGERIIGNYESRKRAERTEIAPLGDEVYTPGPGWGDMGSGARPSRRDPHPLVEILTAFISDSGWKESVNAGELKARWTDIIGQANARHCVIESYKEGTLVLSTSSSSWQAQITALSAVLKEKINKELGAQTVKEIKVYTRWN